MPSDAVIRLDQTRKVYHTGEVDVHAVRGVSLTIQPGEFVAIMGASGSGKSTLMNIIGCLDRATAGRYLLDSVDVSALNRDELAEIRNSKIGFVFQGFNLLSRTSALENVELPMLYVRRSLVRQEQVKRASKALEIVGLADRADHHPNQLSGGQQQRVAIARALVNQPALLLADEPTGELDQATGEHVAELLDRVNADGTALVIVTHDHSLATRARRVLTMRDGRIDSEATR